jgi:NAD(P)H-dependent FMN reductase
MSYFLSITGSQTKFSKSGFLLRATGSILEQRAIELRAIHAVDLPVGEIANRDLTAQFIADTTDQVLQATAILLLTPATKESVPTLLLTLLERLPDNSFFDKQYFCLRPVDCRRTSPSWSAHSATNSFVLGQQLSPPEYT